MSWIDHLIVAPIVLPLLTGALLLIVGRSRRLAVTLSVSASVALLAVAGGLMWVVSDPEVYGRTVAAYRLGDWPAPFGIVLVADRLSALLVLLTAILGLTSLIYALARWHRVGPHFHPLFQFLMMGLNGAFLTGDLFNLFVFFEVLLAASYGLALHGSGRARVKKGLHYIVVNLAASMLFLLGASLVFGVTGTLNMAALAARVPEVAENTRALLHAGAALLGVAFLVKAAAWPMGLWLPGTYAAAAPPVGAMFAIMTKVGIYALMRLGLLVFGDSAGPSAHFGAGLILAAGAATLLVGTIGILASRDLGRMAGYSVLISSGALLGAVGLGDLQVTTGALFYLIVSSVSLAALFLLVGLIAPNLPTDANEPPLLEPFDPAEEALFTEAEETRVRIPVPAALLSACFFICTLLLTGLPPFSGFLAKLALLAPMIAAPSGAPDIAGRVLFGLILFSGLGTLVAMVRFGVRTFWAESDTPFPTIRLLEAAPMVALVALGLILTLIPEATVRYLTAAAQGVHGADRYVAGVLPGRPSQDGSRP